MGLSKRFSRGLEDKALGALLDNLNTLLKQCEDVVNAVSVVSVLGVAVRALRIIVEKAQKSQTNREAMRALCTEVIALLTATKATASEVHQRLEQAYPPGSIDSVQLTERLTLHEGLKEQMKMLQMFAHPYL